MRNAQRNICGCLECLTFFLSVWWILKSLFEWLFTLLAVRDDIMLNSQYRNTIKYDPMTCVFVFPEMGERVKQARSSKCVSYSKYIFLWSVQFCLRVSCSHNYVIAGASFPLCICQKVLTLFSHQIVKTVFIIWWKSRILPKEAAVCGTVHLSK